MTRTEPGPNPSADEGSGPRRAAPNVAQTGNPNAAPRTGSPAGNAPANRQFAGIVGASTTVITAEDIAHSPAQTVQEIIAQTPGVQLTTLFGGVNGAQTNVDLRGFGAFATANSLVLINGRRLNDIDMAGVDLSTIPRNSIERIEITRGNSGAVLYGDNAVGGVINIVTKTGAGGPPVAMRFEGRRRLLQPAHGFGLDRGQFGAVVGILLWQRHQVRRISGQQRARPAQRDRQPQLQHARSHRLPDRVRRRPEAGIAGRPVRRSVDRPQSSSPTDRRGTSTPFDYANKQGANATAGFTKTLWNGAELIVDGGVRDKKQQAGFFGDVAGAELRLELCRHDLADVVADPAIEHQEPASRNALEHPDGRRLLRRDLSLRIAAAFNGFPPIHVYDLHQQTLAGYWQQTIGLLPTTDFSYGARVQDTMPEREGSLRPERAVRLRHPGQPARQQRDAIRAACRHRASLQRGFLGVRPRRPRLPHP